jgi:tetraacyldisaccharide 4'-kinase
MSRLADWAQSVWYEDGRGAAALAPLEWLFRGVSGARRKAYGLGLLRQGHPGVPVIIVGNLTVGGAGKTPLVIWLGQNLQIRGWKPAVVSRGYGGRRGGEPEWVEPGSDPGDFGDEPVLIAEAGLPVAVGRDRLAAAEFARAGGASVILSDDGLQHYALERDLEIVVIDGDRGLGNGRCLPAGPLRESAGRLAEADLIVCNGPGPCPTGGAVYSLAIRTARALDTGECRPLASFRDRPVHAAAGIGNPQRFFNALEEAGLEVLRHPFPDHYGYRAGDLSFGDDLPVLMTSKDAVKARAFDRAGLWEVPAECAFEDDGGERVLDDVEATLHELAAAE